MQPSVWTRLSVQPPFHLEATVRVLQRRPSNPVDVWTQGRYRRVLATAGGSVLVETANFGPLYEPDVRFTVHTPCSNTALAEIERTLRRMLGLDLDPQPLQERALRERKLRPTALALLGMRPPRFAGLFEAFGNVIPFQQLSIDAGVAIATGLVRRFGEPIEHDGRRIYAFPSANVIAHCRLAALRACGLSNTKANALREIARMIASGDLDEQVIDRMSTEEALRLLTALPSIGPWSAALVLLRGFGRLDIFPPGDVGAMRELRALMQLRSNRSLDGVQGRFGDLRGYLYYYGLAASLLARGLIHPAERASSGQAACAESQTRTMGAHCMSANA
jgi:DNA-3-methyladenine glycosylase II